MIARHGVMIDYLMYFIYLSR